MVNRLLQNIILIITKHESKIFHHIHIACRDGSSCIGAERLHGGRTFVGQPVDVGAEVVLTREESTAAVSVITERDTDRRSAKNIGNSIIGQGNGLISLLGSGSYATQNPTFYVRGLQTLNGNDSPLILVDGIERDITTITPEEVASVSVLKDAAAVALYGYKGVNGAVLVTTKRGKSNSRSIKFTYDHLFNSIINKPSLSMPIHTARQSTRPGLTTDSVRVITAMSLTLCAMALTHISIPM